ncbi:carbohydrate porin [Novosphingobium sp. 1949]|uniref:Carbohydrate porin n=1 Tax=Novosphingobium organovorum TaxID=2930092 RepID=A0ABT0BHF8_9SPHN|nr:carbohydrate porin [Novosphingobium organovorum]MCJ2184464.1 carbohydrate porin [Novosphingobium organovorum]
MWALWDAGLVFWPLVSRLMAVGASAVAFSMPALRAARGQALRAARGQGSNKAGAFGLGAVLALGCAATFAAMFTPHSPVPFSGEPANFVPDADTGTQKWKRPINAHAQVWMRCRGLAYFDARAPIPAPSVPGSTQKVGGRFGFYALAQQQIWCQSDAKAGRNLAFIAAYTVNPRTSAQITRWYSLGLVQTGAFAGRDRDTLGLGVVNAVLNPRLRRAYVEDYAPEGGMAALPQGETAIELSYAVQLKPWLIVRPDVQYIVDPGAFSYALRGDAVAAGAQVKMQI